MHRVPLKDGGQIHTNLSSLICWQVAPFLQGFGSHLFKAVKELCMLINESLNKLLKKKPDERSKERRKEGRKHGGEGGSRKERVIDRSCVQQTICFPKLYLQSHCWPLNPSSHMHENFSSESDLVHIPPFLQGLG